jgi:hypothetical protein
VSKTIRVAILDEQLPAQLHERPQDGEGLEIVWTGTQLDDLIRFTAKESPQVIVADLDRLGPDPVSTAERLVRASAAELFVTVYRFASRSAVEHLSGDKRRVLRAPVSIPMLKTQMMSAIVRGLLADGAANTPPIAAPPRGEVRTARGGDLQFPARFTDAQLGALKERPSQIACECPNQVAELVSSLTAFERYSRSCASRDEKDAAMHRSLAEATSEARRVMERVLGELMAYENITV